MLGTISQTMMEQPLSLDQIYLWQNDATLPDYKAGWFTKRLESFKYFLHSFSSETEKENKEEIVLNVWVNRARNYIDLIESGSSAKDRSCLSAIFKEVNTSFLVISQLSFVISS